jgi:hypothetical protein
MAPAIPRPRSITFVAWVFIAVGTVTLLSDWWQLLTPGAAQQLAKLKADGLADLGPAWLTRALAIVGGVGLLRGCNWARWLLLAWMIFHIGLSVMHSPLELAIHVTIYTPLAYLLFRRSTEPYFRPERIATPEPENP